MRYKRKPLEVEAIQFTGTNLPEVQQFITVHITSLTDGTFYIVTPENILHVAINDFIVKGIRGNFFPVTELEFKELYEEAG